jgi:hypothetical protein
MKLKMGRALSAPIFFKEVIKEQTTKKALFSHYNRL